MKRKTLWTVLMYALHPVPWFVVIAGILAQRSWGYMSLEFLASTAAFINIYFWHTTASFELASIKFGEAKREALKQDAEVVVTRHPISDYKPVTPQNDPELAEIARDVRNHLEGEGVECFDAAENVVAAENGWYVVSWKGEEPESEIYATYDR